MDTTHIHNQPPAEVRELLAAWNAHENLRTSGASVAELAESRLALDELRVALHSSVALAS